MKGQRFLIPILLMLWVIVGLCPSHGEGAETAANADSHPAAKGGAPVRVTLELKEAGLEQGIQLRVLFENSGPAGFSLDVCPAMLICCVKGLHPLISCDNTGVGLLDVCTAPKPTPHEVFLPTDSTFSFDLNIPTARLPEVCLKKDQQLSVHVCYETDDHHTIESNVLKFTMQ